MRHSASGSSIALDMLPMPDWRQSVSKPLTYKMGNSTIRFQVRNRQAARIYVLRILIQLIQCFQRPLVAAIVVIVLALCLLVYATTFGHGGGRKKGASKKFSGK